MDLYWSLPAGAVGLLLGGVVGVVWAGIVTRESNRRFFDLTLSILRTLLIDEDAPFLSHYGKLIVNVLRYLGRQMLALLAVLLPLTVVFLYGAPAFHEARNASADFLFIHPAAAASHVEQEPLPSPKLGLIPISSLPDKRSITLRLSGQTLVLTGQRRNHAVTRSGALSGLLLSSLGFEVTETSFFPHPTMILIRPTNGDINPLWPYVSDPEFWFYLAMLLGSVFGVIWSRRRQSGGSPDGALPLISTLDYLLTTLATAHAPFFHWLGNLETRLYRRRLAEQVIERPVFISGVARAGTTILLESMSSAPGVATHRYRDFPFIMSPLFWHAFTRFFAKNQPPRERPHEDGILINRESPEAFEEMIWQFFFPELHHPQAIHRLEPADGREPFAQFFRDHVRKILLLRKGDRYLSKGNYNLTRIPYLLTLFPDARFIIPVRHPVPHVHSLVRQHQLFERHAKRDDRVPNLMRAMGHYEFGPQRHPITFRTEATQSILRSWETGREHLGYAIQWAEAYRYVYERLLGDPRLKDRIRIVRYEDLLADPRNTLESLFQFAQLGLPAYFSSLVHQINPGTSWEHGIEPALRREIWQATKAVATWFSYYSLPGNTPENELNE